MCWTATEWLGVATYGVSPIQVEVKECDEGGMLITPLPMPRVLEGRMSEEEFIDLIHGVNLRAPHQSPLMAGALKFFFAYLCVFFIATPLLLAWEVSGLWFWAVEGFLAAGLVLTLLCALVGFCISVRRPLACLLLLVALLLVDDLHPFRQQERAAMEYVEMKEQEFGPRGLRFTRKAHRNRPSSLVIKVLPMPLRKPRPLHAASREQWQHQHQHQHQPMVIQVPAAKQPDYVSSFSSSDQLLLQQRNNNSYYASPFSPEPASPPPHGFFSHVMHPPPPSAPFVPATSHLRNLPPPPPHLAEV
jgi:hypothetical protein